MKIDRFFAPALLLAAAFSALPAVPAAAQRNDRVLVIFGSDPCPTSNGEEIVVCARKPESERYRIPEELRRTAPTRANESWADRATSIEYVGKTGVRSCSTTGSGGATGCYTEMARKACDENKADGKKCGIKF